VRLIPSAPQPTGTRSRGVTASLKQLESAARQCVDTLEAERFPAPVVYECEQYASKARYLVQKLNPDVPLMTFLQGLYKAIVAA